MSANSCSLLCASFCLGADRFREAFSIKNSPVVINFTLKLKHSINNTINNIRYLIALSIYSFNKLGHASKLK